jgi:beta-lactamase regulating signal transducer with metallopeptidase domain
MGADLLHFAQGAATGPAEFLIASIWQGLLLSSAAWICLKAVPRLAPKTRFGLWMIVFLLAALLPLTAFFRAPAAAISATHAPAHFAAAHLNAGWALVLSGLWLFTSLFSLSRLFSSAYRLRRLARTSTPVDLSSLNGPLVCNLASSAGRPVPVRLSRRIDTPMAVGFFRPAILVPEWLWQKLTPAEMHQVIMHELAHLERRDDWTNLLQKLFRALFPLNPGLLWAERELCWEREMACDDAVLDAAVAPREYAACLTNLAEKRLLRRAQSLAPGAWRRRSELAERVHRILKHKGTLGALKAQPIVAAFLMVYLGAGTVLAHSPSLVTFLPPSSSALESNRSVAATDDSFAIRSGLGSSADGLPAPYIEQASFRTFVSGTAPVRKAKVTRRHTRLNRQSKLNHQPRSMDARVIDAGFIEGVLPALPATAPPVSKTARLADSGTEIVLAVLEISPSLPAVSGSSFSQPQLAAFRSGGGWIIVQL